MVRRAAWTSVRATETLPVPPRSRSGPARSDRIHVVHIAAPRRTRESVRRLLPSRVTPQARQSAFDRRRTACAAGSIPARHEHAICFNHVVCAVRNQARVYAKDVGDGRLGFLLGVVPARELPCRPHDQCRERRNVCQDGCANRTGHALCTVPACSPTGTLAGRPDTSPNRSPVHCPHPHHRMNRSVAG